MAIDKKRCETSGKLSYFDLTHALLLAPLTRSLDIAAHMRLFTESRQVPAPPPQTFQPQRARSAFGCLELRAEQRLLRSLLRECGTQLLQLVVIGCEGESECIALRD